ncbi:hypothetical protein N657DRAFT_685811 [Parathielavia appendiculata]|uniref:Uncharacterized protein n=1 Tax=Parathielavia appendiculata TaxID=2587402 RepID=A0AAN6U984_9PEZI|nr:hypothetical protein N657DRAFT_685811 [Parathielavia appendiculata]
MARSTPAVPPLRQIPLVTVQGTPTSESADEKISKESLRVIDTAVENKALRPVQVHDGLRSSPPRSLTNGHIFKLYTGPFFDTTLSEGESGPCHNTEHAINHANFPPKSPTNLETPPSNSRLELATLAIRAVPKVILTHRPRRQIPSSPPRSLPVRHDEPAPSSSSSSSSSPPNFSKSLLLHHPQTQHRYPHYSSPQAALLLNTLRSYLLLPTTTTGTGTGTNSPESPGAPAAAEVLAGLLLKWPTLRHNLARRNPGLAAQINVLDWRGIEAGLPEGSFTRKLVEEWIYCGDAGSGLFGEWEWPWE